MNHPLSRDEFEALEQVAAAKSYDKPSACIARNAKHLVGIKLLVHRKNGSYELTEKGAEALFTKNCIAGLRAMAANADTRLGAGIATFLCRKGYLQAGSGAGQFAITAKGHECLADIDLSAGKQA
jgi:predicted transcriptional regulator